MPHEDRRGCKVLSSATGPTNCPTAASVGLGRGCWAPGLQPRSIAPLWPFALPTPAQQPSSRSPFAGRMWPAPALGSVRGQWPNCLPWRCRSPWGWREKQRGWISGGNLTNVQSILVNKVCRYWKEKIDVGDGGDRGLGSSCSWRCRILSAECSNAVTCPKPAILVF